jgi:hypothetical protein
MRVDSRYFLVTRIGTLVCLIDSLLVGGHNLAVVIIDYALVSAIDFRDLALEVRLCLPLNRLHVTLELVRVKFRHRVPNPRGLRVPVSWCTALHGPPTSVRIDRFLRKPLDSTPGGRTGRDLLHGSAPSRRLNVVLGGAGLTRCRSPALGDVGAGGRRDAVATLGLGHDTGPVVGGSCPRERLAS